MQRVSSTSRGGFVNVEFNGGSNSLHRYWVSRFCHLAITDVEAIHRADNIVSVSDVTDASRPDLRQIDRNRGLSAVLMVNN